MGSYESDKTGKYNRFNRTIPHGCGWRYERFSSGFNGPGVETKCYRCDGTGIDNFGAHCTSCQNNREEWMNKDTRYLIDLDDQD